MASIMVTGKIRLFLRTSARQFVGALALAFWSYVSIVHHPDHGDLYMFKI
jgi:hypothetical protein